MPEKKSLEQLQTIAKQVRRDIIEMITAAKSGQSIGDVEPAQRALKLPPVEIR